MQLRDEVRAAVSSSVAALAPDCAFARRLRRARIVARERNDEAAPAELPDERWLRERFALDGSLAACVLEPVDGDAPLVVRPVHLHLGLDHLVLAPPSGSAPDDAEAHALAEAANRWLAEDELALVPARTDAWRLEARSAQARATIDGFAALRAPSARVASGRNIVAWQPQGEAARRWRGFENLVQMAWFEHPVNEQRMAEGRLPIGALWLEGRAGSAGARPFARVRTDDPAVAGLARRAGAQVAPLDADEPLDAATLVDAGFWKQPLAEGDLDGWNEAWRAFARWFDAAAQPVASLRVVLTGERDCVEIAFEAADRFKPWRSLDRDKLLERAG